MERSNNVVPEIRETSVLNAPIQRVWEAVATSEGLASWFMPNNFKPEIGREFLLDAGQWGKSPCKVTELDPPKRLAFQWDKDWTVTFELTDLNGKTELTLIHSGWDPDGTTKFGEPHAEVRDRMAKGWSGLQKALRAYVEG